MASNRHRLVPFGGKIAAGLAAGRPGGGQFVGVDQEGRLAEECIATAVVGMQVGVDDHVDVVGLQSQFGKSGQHVLAGLHDRNHELGQPAPPALRILRHCRMAAGVEEHVGLIVAQQRARHGELDRLAALGGWQENALAHFQAAAGQ